MISPSPDELDPDWHKYPDTILRFRSEPVARIDLREPVTADVLAQLSGIGLEGPFAVLTAHDPRGVDESPSVNSERAARLDERLHALSAEFTHVDACSPDGSHCEDSVAVITTRDAATTLAREFDQVAIFWFDGEKFWIVPTIVEGDPVMLPRPT